MAVVVQGDVYVCVCVCYGTCVVGEVEVAAKNIGGRQVGKIEATCTDADGAGHLAG